MTVSFFLSNTHVHSLTLPMPFFLFLEVLWLFWGTLGKPTLFLILHNAYGVTDLMGVEVCEQIHQCLLSSWCMGGTEWEWAICSLYPPHSHPVEKHKDVCFSSWGDRCSEKKQFLLPIAAAWGFWSRSVWLQGCAPFLGSSEPAF